MPKLGRAIFHGRKPGSRKLAIPAKDDPNYRRDRWKNGHDRNLFYIREYGLTLEQYNKLLELQGGTCALCHRVRDIYEGEKRRNLSVDHDHTTKRVRGLLCYRCNRYIVGQNTRDTVWRLAQYIHNDIDGRTL